MSRELNPELFPQRREVKSEAKPSERVASPAPLAANEEDVRVVASQVELIKRKFKELESKLEMSNTRLTDIVASTKTRFERLAGHGQRMEEAMKASVQDMNAKVSQLASRLNERKVLEAKTQELLDRHHQLVQSFEVRLNQMQRVISEQDLQLAASRAELKEAQRELARLKRV